MSSGEPSSLAAQATLAGSPDSAESIAAANGESTNAPGRATQFSSHSATPSTSFSRDIRKDPIPAPGAAGSNSSDLSTDSSHPASHTSQQPSTTSQPASNGGGGGKSMFDETPEQAAEKKDYLRKLSSGNKDAVAQYEEAHKNDHSSHIDTSKPVNPSAQMDVEQWGSSKDPVYNSVAAAKDDYYEPAHNPNEEVQEDVTVAATKLLLADPTKIAQAAKQASTTK